MINPSPEVPYEPFQPLPSALEVVSGFRSVLARRRSVRAFSRQPVDERVIEAAVAAAGTAPSGANKQPWRFVVVGDPELKRRIREGAEQEEREFYSRRAGEEWLKDLAPLGTDDSKPFLEDAPWLIVVFKLMKGDPDSTGKQGQVYYVNESVGIAVGMLLAALQHAGLATLTHTPSPMAFLAGMLGRPEHERPYLLIPVGYAAQGCRVPDIRRKPLDQILVWHRPPAGPARAGSRA
jgi:nitroreductase